MLSGRRFRRVEPRDGFISSKNKEPKKYRGVLPSCCFGQLGGRRRSCFAYIDSELKMQSLSQRAWRFVFFSPRVYLALQHPSFSIFTSEVFLPSNHKGGWILSSFFFLCRYYPQAQQDRPSRVISHVWQNDLVGLFSDTLPPDYLPPSTGMFGGGNSDISHLHVGNVSDLRRK